MYYQQRITNSVQRPSTQYPFGSPIMGQQRRDHQLISPTLHPNMYPTNTAPKSFHQEQEIQQQPKEFQRQQLDSLYMNLKKENQQLKEKLMDLDKQIDVAQQKLNVLRQQ